MQYRLGILLLTALACTGCDQSTKLMARRLLEPNQPISLLNDSLRLVLAENSGSFLSLGQSLPDAVRDVLFLVVVPLLLLAAVFYFVANRRFGLDKVVAAGLFVGGGLGNLIDRVLNDGRVFDFLNVGIGGLRTGIFNVADMILLAAIAYMVFGKDAAHADAGI